MSVLKFDGTDDKLKWTTLASALANVSDGAWTLAALVKRNATGAVDDAVVSLLSGSGDGTREVNLNFSSNAPTDRASIAVDAEAWSTSTFTSTTSPYLLVLSKASGTVAPRLGWKLGSGGAWTHENMDANIADQIASTMLEIGGRLADVNLFDGWIGLVAFWEGAMSDATKEALDDHWRTSDWWGSAHGQPVFLVELNVAGASVMDLAGNASNLTATGTTLDAAETLNAWVFDGTGATLVRVEYRQFPKPLIREAALRGEL